MPIRSFWFGLALVVAMGCGPSGTLNPDAGGGGDPDSSTSCNDGATQCNGQTFQSCQNGTWVDTQSCAPPLFCSAISGCVECFPNTNYCVDNSVYSCDANGQSGGKVEDCSGGLQCEGGSCKDLCAEAEANRSYLGCEYWAVDLDNAIEVNGLPNGVFGCLLAGGTELTNVKVCINGTTVEGECDPGDTCPKAEFTCEAHTVCGFDAQHSPFAIVVSNPQTFSVNVTLSNSTGTTQTVAVAAGQVHKMYPQMMGFPDQSLDGSGKSAKAYKITADAPIVAYQFNPLDNADVFSNDGSLLIPRSTFDGRYYAMSWPTLNRRNGTTLPKNDYHGYLAVVAWEDDTQISVTPTADITIGIDGFAAIAEGTPTAFTLNAFEVLHLQAANTVAKPSQDLTGSIVESTNAKTFGMFGGHEAIVIQNTSSSCCADHVEEMMFPTSTWGIEYAIARSQSRGKGEPDLLRVMAQADGTQVTFNPSPAEGTCPTLNAGQFCDVKIQVDTEVSGGDKPILIGHYLLSVIVAAGDLGDPAMALAVPTEQFRSTYTFLVPSEYAQQYVSIVANAGATVTLDGNAVSGFTNFGSSGYAAVRVPVQPGQHKIDCGGGCGIEVYGYDDAVSYLFAGGLDLERIVVD
ncbi:MAG TPA: IgGFc-binding protein [Kofleriaceae bacterium]|nr:IgGFc-binding protein [Kofleriaceae bacterium]